MPSVDAEQLKKNLEKIKHELGTKVQAALQQLGEEMHQDISTTMSYGHSPSWQAAIHETGPYAGQPYFKQANTYIGLLDVIRDQRESMVHTEIVDGSAVLGFGHVPTLDELAPYWELFERDYEGDRPTSTREGMDDKNGFVSIPGFGNRGEGIKEEANSKEDKTHPGVLGVNLFGDEYLYYKPHIDKVIKDTIDEVLKQNK